MKIIIAGSRLINRYQDVLDGIVASGFWKDYKRTLEVVSGCAAGVDRLGEQFANRNGLVIHTFPAAWGDIEAPGAVIRYNRFGKPYNVLAGLWRNHEMGDFADILLAIHNGKSTGTQDMIDYMGPKGLDKPFYVHIPDRFK